VTKGDALRDYTDISTTGRKRDWSALSNCSAMLRVVWLQ